MPSPSSPRTASSRLPFALLCALLVILWIAGGASRADVAGQVAVRGAAILALALLVLFGDLRSQRLVWPVWALLGGLALIMVAQLVPLPPDVWSALPGHALFLQAAAASGQPQPWRPLSISPGATVNSLLSLLAPVATVALAAACSPPQRARLAGALLAFLAATMLLGLLQLSGGGVANPLINYVGQISGNFANRNHFALAMAVGCLLAPTWLLRQSRPPFWAWAVALGLLLMFSLMILASGSRAGLVVGALALALAAVVSRREIARRLAAAPRWATPALIGGFALLLVGFVALSVFADRAQSITRLIEVDRAGDLRSLARPTILTAIGAFLPFGSGFGTFDPTFRIFEPVALLDVNYLNQAHNDLLSLALEGGVPVLLLLLAAIGWWLWTVRSVVRDGRVSGGSLRATGAAILVVIVVASGLDYPARTPTVMMLAAIAAVWLGSPDAQGARFTSETPEPIRRSPRSWLRKMRR